MNVNESKINKIKKNTNILIKLIIVILVLFLIFEIFINFYSIISGIYSLTIFNINFNLANFLNNYKTILTIELSVTIILIVIIKIISHIYIDKLEWKYIKDYLYSIDNNYIIQINLKDEIIEGNLKMEGCKRIRNKYMIYLPKYNCSIKRFDEQELLGYIRILRNNISFRNDIKLKRLSLPDFNFFTLDSIIEYTFNMLDKDKYFPYLYETLRKKFNDISILDNKIIIRHHLYDNSINEANHEYFNHLKKYDFTVNIFKTDNNDNIKSIIEKTKNIYFEINNQTMEKSIYGNKNQKN